MTLKQQGGSGGGELGGLGDAALQVLTPNPGKQMSRSRALFHASDLPSSQRRRQGPYRVGARPAEG